MGVVVEVIFRNNVAGGYVGDIKSYEEDSLLLKALLLGNHAEVLNPPDWSLEKKEQAAHGKNKNQPAATEPIIERSAATSVRPTGEGTTDSGRNEEASPPRYRRSSELVLDASSDKTREAINPDSVKRSTD